MRVPEPLFPVINCAMKLLLASPLHMLASGSILTIHFTGRRSGRALSTPVRYLRNGDATLAALTDRDTRWWPNFREPAAVQLQLAGRRVAATAHATADDAALAATALDRALARFPGDAAYHGITARRGSDAYRRQRETAIGNAVVVVFTLRD